MSRNNTENKEMNITTLEEEIKKAKDQVWDLMLFGASSEEILRCQAYIRYLENEKIALEKE